MSKGFSKVSHNFPVWNKKLRKVLTLESKLIYFALFTSPLTDFRGLFQIETEDLLKTGIKESEIEKCFKQLIENDLIKYDESNCIIFIPEMTKNINWGRNELKGFYDYIYDMESYLLKDVYDFVNMLPISEKAESEILPLIKELSSKIIEPFSNPLVTPSVVVAKGLPIAIEPLSNPLPTPSVVVKKDDGMLLDAEEIYDWYKDNLVGGKKETSLIYLASVKEYKRKKVSPALVLYSKAQIMECLIKYKEVKKGVTNKQFISKPQNFFNPVDGDFLNYVSSKKINENKIKFSLSKNVEYIINNMDKNKFYRFLELRAGEIFMFLDDDFLQSELISDRLRLVDKLAKQFIDNK